MQRDALVIEHRLDELTGDAEPFVHRVRLAAAQHEATDVDQDTAADDASTGHVVDAEPAGVEIGLLAAPPVSELPVAHVRQSVPLRGVLRVEAVQPVVSSSSSHRHVVGERRARREDAWPGFVEGQRQRDHRAVPDQARGGADDVGGQPVQAADVVVVPPGPPGVALLGAG